MFLEVKIDKKKYPLAYSFISVWLSQDFPEVHSLNSDILLVAAQFWTQTFLLNVKSDVFSSTNI